MATTKRRLRVLDGQETAPTAEEVSAATQAPEQPQNAVSAPQTPTPQPQQYNERDAKLAMERVNELLAAIQRQGAMIPPQALAGLQAQAQALAALRLMVNYLGVPEPVAQVAESQAMHQLLAAVLVDVEAQAAQRGKPQIVVPGRH